MEQLLHAIDGAMLGRWSSARAGLQRAGTLGTDALVARLLALVDRLERAELARRGHASLLECEIGNSLSVASATIEGMLDGVLSRSDGELRVALDALKAAGAMLGEITRELRLPDEQRGAQR